MKSKEAYWYKQSGVIPYRIVKNNPDGDVHLEILLITSRKRKHWIIPKGIVEPGMTAHESAEKEAIEEAGILGEVSSQALGGYQHQKWGGTCEIEVFPLKVETVLDEWPEMQTRKRKWMIPDEARDNVRNEQLKEIISRLPKKILDRQH